MPNISCACGISTIKVDIWYLYLERAFFILRHLTDPNARHFLCVMVRAAFVSRANCSSIWSFLSKSVEGPLFPFWNFLADVDKTLSFRYGCPWMPHLVKDGSGKSSDLSVQSVAFGAKRSLLVFGVGATDLWIKLRALVSQRGQNWSNRL